MNEASRTLVVLCTYNEIENLPKAVSLIHESVPSADILVVDDDSPDGTGAWVKSSVDKQLFLLARPGKLGLGTAFKDAIRWCLERDYQFLVNLDADLSHDPKSIPDMLAPCVSGQCDVAVGSRYIAGGGFSNLAWHRRLISKLLNAYATRVLGLPISDCSGSFRAYNVHALKALDLETLTCSGYGFLEEILVALHRNGMRLCEVPIMFEARWAGYSKLGMSDALGALQVIHRLGFRRR